MSASPMVALGEILQPAKAPRMNKNDYPILSITMHGGLVPQADRFKKRIASKDTSRYKVVARNQLVVAFPIDEAVLDFQTIFDYAAVSPAYTIWETKPGIDVHVEYLRLFLRSPAAVRQYVARLRGTTARRRSLNQSDFQSIALPLPSHDEQHRISSALKRTKSMVSTSAGRARTLSAVKASQFSRVVSLTDSRAPLSDLASIRAGNSLSAGSEFTGQAEGSLLLRVSDLNHPQNTHRVNVAARWSPDEANRSTSAPAGSVVFPKRGGAIGTNKKRVLGRMAQLDPNLMGLAPQDDRCPAEWLATWLDTIDLGTLANGSSVPQINKKDVKDLMVPVPSTEHLQLFRQLTQQTERLQSVVQQQIDSAQELYDSLQYRAFRGEL